MGPFEIENCEYFRRNENLQNRFYFIKKVNKTYTKTNDTSQVIIYL